MNKQHCNFFTYVMTVTSEKLGAVCINLLNQLNVINLGMYLCELCAKHTKGSVAL